MSYITSVPSVWYTQTAPPATIQDNSLYIWEQTGFLQLGVAVKLPGTITPTHVLVVLSSEERGYPDSGIYTQIIRHVVTAYKTQTLEIHRTTVANEVLTPIPLSTVTVSTAKTPAIFVRYQFTVNSDNQCVVSLVVTDTHGFILAKNETTVIESHSTTPVVVTGNNDVMSLPIVTTPVSQSGNFTGSTLVSVGTTNLTSHRPLPMLWYGTLGSALPSAVDIKHIAVWYDSANKLKFSLALPFDELLTKPTSNFRRGTISDHAGTFGTLCNGKWWLMLDLTTGLAANREAAFLTKLLGAANSGTLFITPIIPVSLTDSNAITYHAISNSVTVNFGMRHGSRTATNIGTYYDQLAYISIMSDTGEILCQASARVRAECSGGVALFPNDAMFLGTYGLNCNLASCGNTYLMGRLVANGPSTGINVLQGKGGLPTGTTMGGGISATTWDLVRFSVTNYNSYPTWHDAYATNANELAGPYMGYVRSVHSNHTARALRLGYSHYFYPDVFHPLDIGKIPTFGAVVTGVNLTAWITSKTAVVADDDHVSAITEAAKGKSVYLSVPSYTGVSATTQDATKNVFLYLPDSDHQYATVPMTSDNALTMDLSSYRKPTPLLSTGYGKPIHEYQCHAELTNNTLTFESTSTVPRGANLFIGFSRKASDSSYCISHTLTLPNPLTTNRVFTGITSYPEFAVPFTCSNPVDIGSGTLTPLAPAFTGKLPPGYRMIWVDWASITAVSINVYYWKADDQYNVSTVYTAPPPGNAVVTLSLPVVAGAHAAMVLDGSVRLLMELTNSTTGDFGNLKLYAGNTLVASSNNTLPWINAGSVMIHAHGDSNIDEVIVGDILITSGAYSPITTVVPGVEVIHTDYVELQVESISTPITPSTYEALSLKPYTIYWETTQKVLYLPVLNRAVNIPTQLAKCTAYSQQSATPAVITALLAISGPVTRVYLSATHGLQYVPVGTNYQVFTTQDSVTTDDTIIYHWRTGANYTTSLGPLGATIIPGVTIPKAVSSTSSGLTTNLISALSLASQANLYNIEGLDTNMLLTGIQDGTAFAKLPLVFSNEYVSKYTVQFTRASAGTWQVNQTITSHFSISIYPSKPDYVGVTNFPLLSKPQQKAVRILFPRSTGTVVVQTGTYRGYGWDSVGVSSYVSEVAPFDQVIPLALSGGGQVSDSSGKAIIAITFSNINGQMGITVYENRVPKLTGTLPIPYINNGTLAFTLQNAGSQSTELLGNVSLIEGDQIDESGQQGNVIYCVPTATFDHSARLDANKEVIVTAIPGNYRYAFISYTLTNNGLAIGKVATHATLDTIGENTRIGNVELAPNTSKVVELVLVNRNEKIVFVSTVPNIDVLVTVIAQL